MYDFCYFFFKFSFFIFTFRINFPRTSNSVRNINTLTLLLFVLGKSVRPLRADFLFSPLFLLFFLQLRVPTFYHTYSRSEKENLE